MQNQTRRKLTNLFFRFSEFELSVEYIENVTDENSDDIKTEIEELKRLSMVEEVGENTYKANKESETMRGYFEFANSFLETDEPVFDRD